jgi:hypothetical protein
MIAVALRTARSIAARQFSMAFLADMAYRSVF